MRRVRFSLAAHAFTSIGLQFGEASREATRVLGNSVQSTCTASQLFPDISAVFATESPLLCYSFGEATPFCAPVLLLCRRTVIDETRHF